MLAAGFIQNTLCLGLANVSIEQYITVYHCTVLYCDVGAGLLCRSVYTLHYSVHKIVIY